MRPFVILILGLSLLCLPGCFARPELGWHDPPGSSRPVDPTPVPDPDPGPRPVPDYISDKDPPSAPKPAPKHDKPPVSDDDAPSAPKPVPNHDAGDPQDPRPDRQGPRDVPRPPWGDSTPAPPNPSFEPEENPSEEALSPSEAAENRIQLAILVDTSHSMKDSLDRLRVEALGVAKEFRRLRRNGRPARIEVALYEFGNEHVAETQGFVRQVLPFTSDLTRVEAAFKKLRTSGGDEYHGWALRAALEELPWGVEPGDTRVIVLAGNEPYDQGPVAANPEEIKAFGLDIEVRTIFCGRSADADATLWSTWFFLNDTQPDPQHKACIMEEWVYKPAHKKGYVLTLEPSARQRWMEVARLADQAASALKAASHSSRVVSEYRAIAQHARALSAGEAVDCGILTYNVGRSRQRVLAEKPEPKVFEAIVSLEKAVEKSVEAYGLRIRRSS